MSDSNRTKVGFVKEAVPGTTPANPKIKNLRITGSQLAFNTQTVESKELRTDRQLADLIRVGIEAGGAVPVEVSYGSLDDIYENVLQSSWQRFPVRDNDGTADSNITDVSAGTGVYTVVAAPGTPTDAAAGAFVVGQLVRASGFTNSANNALRRVTAATGTSVTLGNASVAEAAPPASARLKVVGFQGAAGDLTATATGLASTALDFTTLGLVAGMWVKIGGSVAGEQFATAANNGWARITGVAANALTLDNLPAGWGVDAGATKTITVWVGDYIRNGTTPQAWTLEKQMTDLTAPEFDYYTGSYVDQLALSLKSKAVLDASATFACLNAKNELARVAGASDIAAKTNEVLNTSANVGYVADAGTQLVGSTAVTSLDLTLSNSLRRRDGIGSLATQAFGIGTFRCSGKMNLYYANNVIRQKVLNGTASSFTSRVVDPTAPNNKRGYVWDLPRTKFTGGNPQEPGIDTDRTIDPEFTALAHPTLGYAFQVQRFDEFFEA